MMFHLLFFPPNRCTGRHLPREPGAAGGHGHASQDSRGPALCHSPQRGGVEETPATEPNQDETAPATGKGDRLIVIHVFWIRHINSGLEEEPYQDEAAPAIGKEDVLIVILSPASLARGGGYRNAPCPSVRPSVCLSVRPSR